MRVAERRASAEPTVQEQVPSAGRKERLSPPRGSGGVSLLSPPSGAPLPSLLFEDACEAYSSP